MNPTLRTPKPNGFVLEFDAARKIAQGLGADLQARPPCRDKW